MRPGREGRKWHQGKSFWVLILWSALWVAWLVYNGGGSVGSFSLAILGFIVCSSIWLWTRNESRMEDWERRKREAETLAALQRDALDAREFEREVVELEGDERR
jgi:hypothetical protein